MRVTRLIDTFSSRGANVNPPTKTARMTWDHDPSNGLDFRGIFERHTLNSRMANLNSRIGSGAADMKKGVMSLTYSQYNRAARLYNDMNFDLVLRNHRNKIALPTKERHKMTPHGERTSSILNLFEKLVLFDPSFGSKFRRVWSPYSRILVLNDSASLVSLHLNLTRAAPKHLTMADMP
jgi:hypothetical protein